MRPIVWIAGVGGIGGVVGYRLTKAGRAPVLVDGWAEHVGAMNAQGLVLKGQFDDAAVPVRAVTIDELDSAGEAPDLVYLCVKSFQTEDTVRALLPYLTSSSSVVSLQNGINEEAIAQAIGKERVIGGVALIDGALIAPGVARQDNPAERGFVLGDLAGRASEVVERAAAVLSDFGEVRITSNIWGELWAKLVHNCMMNAVCTLTGRNAAWILRDPAVWRFARALEAEAVRVALASGVTPEGSCLYGCTPQDFLEEAGEPRVAQALRAAYPASGDLYPSMVQDVWKGRPTEIEFMNGFIVRKGEQVGIETPHNAAITALIHRIERGELEPDATNKHLLQDALPGLASAKDTGVGRR